MPGLRRMRGLDPCKSCHLSLVVSPLPLNFRGKLWLGMEQQAIIKEKWLPVPLPPDSAKSTRKPCDEVKACRPVRFGAREDRPEEGG